MPTGMAGVTEITIERWTTKAERDSLLGLVETAKLGEGGQRKLLDALQKIKPRTGFIRTPNSLGWDLRYAVENNLEDGTRQIVIVIDKPVSFAAAAGASEAMDYPFTLIEMRVKPNEKGEMVQCEPEPSDLRRHGTAWGHDRASGQDAFQPSRGKFNASRRRR